MVLVASKSVVAVDCPPGFRLRVGDNLLTSPEGCSAVLQDLLETAPQDLAGKDIAVLNLLCAHGLPGSEHLDIPKCRKRLDELAAFVRAGIERTQFRPESQFGHCKPMWQLAHLVTMVKRDFGAMYNPRIRDNRLADISEPITDSREVFLHGLLDDNPKRRWGTCASIPVLVTAVARRLGYPVGLAVAGRHIYARWEDPDVCFNIEASNPMGMTVHSDDEFREKIRSTPGVPGEEDSGYYLRTLSAAEEFALFMTLRVEFLVDAARYEDTLLWSARALQFAPEDPRFPRTAHYGLDLAMKHRLRRVHPEQKIPPAEDPKPFFFNVGDLLRREERSLHMTIAAHHKEAQGDFAEARALYEEACRQNFHGNNEQRDLQRFLRKHNLRHKTGPLMPPKNLGLPRRWTLACKPHEEADTLRRLADEFEGNGELVKARDALHDLYMFDPANAAVLQRARAFEDHPVFQQQLKALIAKRRSELRSDAIASAVTKQRT